MRLNFLGLCFLLFSQVTFSAVKIEHWQTSQGSPVFFVASKGLAMVDIQVVFDAGSARDEYQHGIAALTSALLVSGTKEWNADEIAQRFESVGAQFNTGVSRDMAWLSLRSLTAEKWLSKALQTMRLVLSQATFNIADFQREKSRALVGLKHREELPSAIAQIAFLKALYKEHPYAHPTNGVIATVSNLSVENLRDFYQQHYTANNAMVVIVGNMETAQARSTAELLMADLAIGKQLTKIPALSSLTERFTQHIDFPSVQTHILAGLIGMSREDKDYFSLYVGNHILGGSGLVSQLSEEIREKRGLAYSAYSYFSPWLKKGPFIMGLQTRNNQTQQAIHIMQKILKDFVEKGPTEQVLIAAKKNITGGFALRFDSNRKLINYLTMIGFYQLPLDYLEVFQQRVEQVTVTSIKDAFKRRVKPELLQTISVGGLSD